MKKLLTALALVPLLAGALWTQTAVPPRPPRPAAPRAPAVAPVPSPFGEIPEIVTELSQISGLKQLREVEHDRINKEQVKAFLEQRVRETVKPEEVRQEELALKKFGFVPQDFDLLKTTVELLTEQAAAFYDFRKKKLFLIDSSSDLLQQTALVHELAHALADQHFHLEKFIDKERNNDDASLARMAVMEGQATWLMAEYMARRSGQSLRISAALVEMMSRMTAVSAGQYPVFDKAPLYLKESLLFPYAQGFLFQQAVVMKLGQAAFAEIFRQPPRSSQQILHPEKYLAGTLPAALAPPAPSNPREYRIVTEGTLGEFDHSILLRQYAGGKEAGAVAPLWRGGAFQLLERKADKRLELAYASVWEDAQGSREFFRLYQRVLRGKWKKFEIEAETEDAVAGRGDDGYFLLRRQGAVVTSREGLESAAEISALH